MKVKFALEETIDFKGLTEFRKFIEDHMDDEIDLFCAGRGGNIDEARGFIGLINIHGNVNGILLGNAISCHAIIFAACKQRFIYPHAVMSIHRGTQYLGLEAWYDANSLASMARNLRNFDDFAIDIFTAASKMPKQWWASMYEIAGVDLYSVSFQELIDIGLAKPVTRS